MARVTTSVTCRRITTNLLEVVAEDVYVVVPPPNWPEHFRDLLLSELGADVRFRVGGETFPAHRCVLAARSPVFKAQLFYGDDAPCVDVDQMEAGVFRHLLHFVYTDSLPPSTDAAMDRHLLGAADRYELGRLRLVCEKRLCGYVDASTVVATLTWADRHRCHGLKNACFAFIASQVQINAVGAIEGFHDFIRACSPLLKEVMRTVAGLPAEEEIIE